MSELSKEWLQFDFLCDQKQFDNALTQFDKCIYFEKFNMYSNDSLSSEFIKPNNEPIQNFWKTYRTVNKYNNASTEACFTEIAENIKQDLMATKESIKSILDFFPNIKEKQKCIRAYIEYSCMVGLGAKQLYLDVYDNPIVKEFMVNAWQYNFYLLKVIVTGICNLMFMKEQEMKNQKLTNMTETTLFKNNGTPYTNMYTFVENCLAADEIVNGKEIPDTKCFVCGEAATKDVKIVVHTAKKTADPEIQVKTFLFCTKCKFPVTGFLIMLKYSTFAKASVIEKIGYDASLDKFLSNQANIIAEEDKMDRAITYFINFFCANASNISDEIVLGMAETFPSLSMDKTDPWYNPQKIKKISLTYKAKPKMNEFN